MEYQSLIVSQGTLVGFAAPFSTNSLIHHSPLEREPFAVHSCLMISVQYFSSCAARDIDHPSTSGHASAEQQVTFTRSCVYQ